jgi:hypothetical protein
MKTPPTTIAPEDPEPAAHGRPGEAVTIGDGIPAHVTSIQLRQSADGSIYLSAIEVAYWDGCSRRCEWLEPWEVSPVAGEPGKIGFAAQLPVAS